MIRNVLIFSTVVCLTLAVACTRDNPFILEVISSLGPFTQFSEYDTYGEEKTSRGIKWVAKRKLVILVRKELSAEELKKIGLTYNRAYPNTEVDFFDDVSGLNNYVNLDSFNGENGARSDHILDADFISKHLVATLSEASPNEWRVSTENYYKKLPPPIKH